MLNLKSTKPVAIIGAGPVGLAAAAHLVSQNIPFKLFEAGKEVGANLLDWGHVRVFTPWKYVVDPTAAELLKGTNWAMPEEDLLPTGEQIVQEYLIPLSKHPKISDNVFLGTKVLDVSKKRMSKIQTHAREAAPFVVKTAQNGREQVLEASAIIDASGTWQNYNPIGAGGVFATGERENADKIAYRIPDIQGKDLKRYANKAIAVVGGGHSAINSLLDLASLKENYPDTSLHWILQTENLTKIYGGKDNDELQARGALGTRIEALVLQKALTIHTPVFIGTVERHHEKLNLKGEINFSKWSLNNIDEVIANTGGRPDFNFLREVRYQADPIIESVPELADLIDPNKHSCGTVKPHGELELKQPEPNFYIVGVKSYGRAPTFLMPTGYEQVRSIAAWLAGDVAAARRVELNLPETGVCSADFATGESCCGPSSESEQTSASSCCAQRVSEKTQTDAVKVSSGGGCCTPEPSVSIIEKQIELPKQMETSCCSPTPQKAKTVKVLQTSCCG